MHFLVRVELIPLGERFRARSAFIRLFARMLSRMRFKIGNVGKLHIAFGARVWLHLCVRPLMFLQVTLREAQLFALVTFETPFV